MIQRVWTIALLSCFACFQTVVSAEETETPTNSAVVESDKELSLVDKDLEEKHNSPENSTNKTTTPGNKFQADDLSYTFWDFEIELKGFQREPAGKNHDEFNAKLKFAALQPHATNKVQSWSGFGNMTAKVISRAPRSFQAPHRAVPQYGVQANSYWDHTSKMISVNVHPEDAVTYSLTTGEVLGTTSVLMFMLPNATGPGLHGTLQTFSIPENVEPGAEFHCTFDTSEKHVCWYEGKATLRVLSKKSGKFSRIEDITSSEAKQEGKLDDLSGPAAPEPESVEESEPVKSEEKSGVRDKNGKQQ